MCPPRRGSLVSSPLGSDIFLVKNFKNPKEPHQVQYDQKKQSLRRQASTCPKYKSFSLCSLTVAIGFKLNIFASYIKKVERRMQLDSNPQAPSS